MPSRLSVSARIFAASLVLAAAGGSPALAKNAPQGMIDLELNALEKSDKGCRITFVVKNSLGSDVTRTVYEIALFNRQGLVERLMKLEFKDLPDQKTKVSRFDLADTDCDAIGRVLINDADACEGDGVQAGDCIARLNATSRSSVTFGK
ncbi:hypothetical protein JYP49_06735 [Nitratireductor aquimarinus]|uniref:hypothetical protein n=1 Tax=Nitratireductor TaxID=245876 RepID=UPI0019D34827|nr:MULTISPECIES: hypothetical protein [Nitratireductor]MBN7776944.1 hypothetical protein [Nitratireductor pacificus]MBN7780278.1 hypothetical protein [Nitratireductor pacificus]MBN7789085.1 hypothetical protein [Nitratireductor aquimarinus]MBY6099153.1 hypothetical protein [Nitratireductor aquimarinus]MCA1262231.1 hypothetical protein [Nitratireductor aquimarinus]